MISDNVDNLTIAENKIDSSFPTAQFCVANYHAPYRLDISDKTGGIRVYITYSYTSTKLWKFL